MRLFGKLDHHAVSLVVAMLCFGAIGVCFKFAGIDVHSFVFARCLVGALTMALVVVVTRGNTPSGIFRSIDRKQVFSGLLLTLNWIFLFKALESLSVSVAVSVYYLAPSLILLGSRVFFGEKVRAIDWLGILLCFVGNALIAALRLDSGETWNVGLAYAFAAAAFYAGMTLVNKKPSRIAPAQNTFGQLLTGAFVLIPFVQLGHFVGLSVTNWVAILTAACVLTGFAYLLFFLSIPHLRSRVVSSLLFLDPLTAIVLDMAIFRFQPGALQALGIATLLGGLVLISSGRD